ncbi:hypothetical protein ABZ249_12145 [Nocardiopsis sp. NPDC006139]|uniref:hypothetical protein n=1 Tax=Nocardiopsis sp. NPDC006139 TaxID=3154578 RepID=UPI0033BC0A5E
MLVAFHRTPGPRFGLDLIEATGLSSGRVYLALARLTGAGWVAKRWQEPHEIPHDHPARVLYELAPLPPGSRVR